VPGGRQFRPGDSRVYDSRSSIVSTRIFAIALSSNVIIVLSIIEPLFWVHKPERFMVARIHAHIHLNFERKERIPLLPTSLLLTILP